MHVLHQVSPPVRSQHGVPCKHKPLVQRCKVVGHAVKQDLTADVCVVGGGIIGLLVAQQLLKQKLSVIMVERQQLCAGATGAGQGYIWMAHRSPDTAGWDLAATSTALWRGMIQGSPQEQELARAIEWQDTGSLLLASTPSEAGLLVDRASLLQRHGISAQHLSAQQVMAFEPAVKLSKSGAGLLVKSDAQINGRRTAAVLLNRCTAHGSQFQALMDEPVEALYCEGGCQGNGSEASHVVLTRNHRIRGRHATVIAAGVWSGQLLARVTGQPLWSAALVPRRGHLLEVERPEGMPDVKLGMMEMSYTKHYSAPPSQEAGQPEHASSRCSSKADSAPDITFTATTSAAGTLLIGSSREVGVLDKTADPQVVQAIMRRAEEFLPGLAAVRQQPSGEAVRVGPRPYAVGGLPIIGPVPAQPGLFVAAGHEGSGLCLGPATAHLITEYVLQHMNHTGHDAERGSLPPRHPSGHHHDLEAWGRTCREFLPEVRLLVAEM